MKIIYFCLKFYYIKNIYIKSLSAVIMCSMAEEGSKALLSFNLNSMNLCTTSILLYIPENFDTLIIRHP